MDLPVDHTMEALLDLFLFETSQNIEQLEKIILDYENTSGFTDEAINEIFRIMHTIKGSAAMMMFSDISSVAHSVEDLFYFIREQGSGHMDYSGVPDLILESLDFIRERMEKIKLGVTEDDDGSLIESKISDFLAQLKAKCRQVVLHDEKTDEMEALLQEKQDWPGSNAEEKVSGEHYKAHVFFEEGCQMESIRAFDLANRLASFASHVHCVPEDIMENDNSAVLIREKGFDVFFETEKNYDEAYEFFAGIMFLREVSLEKLTESKPILDLSDPPESAEKILKTENRMEDMATQVSSSSSFSADMHNTSVATIINVNVAKLDKLMDLVGEMVISEAMVVQNPDLKGLELENFKKAALQLHKITSELQDTVMSIRMVPLADIFQKMHRVVRDMGKKLQKEIKLEIIGEETEVDKNIIKHLSDPLMHLVRNAIDHGIEDTETRAAKNKPRVGTVTLEAKNAGNDVLVIIRDDGSGLDRNKILEKARQNKLLKRNPSEMSDKEIFNLIFLPGFSTNDNITEYSGRGVGMDIVARNIEEVGGAVSVDSMEGAGTAITIKIPLTLAIIDGMNIRVGSSCYTIPTISIRESFRPKREDIITDLDGNEIVMVWGQCYSITRLHEYFKAKNAVADFTDGIFIMVEQDGKMVCLFADELLGQQQVVVKTLPLYIKNTYKVHGVAGCTLLGDGSISLILDIGWFVGSKQ